MYRILLFTDSKWRDLPSTALIKHNLLSLSDNVDVRVVSFGNDIGFWQTAINLYNPHLVVLNHIQGKRNRMIASHVRRHGGIVVVQFNEGIIEFDGKAAVFRQQKDDPDVDLFLCWNQQTADLVGGEIVGCPRFDVYGEYKQLIDNKLLFCDKYGLDAKREIIVFGDSWPSAKFKYSLRDFHRSNWKDLQNQVADKWSNADEFAEVQFRYQEDFKLMVLNTRYYLPDVQIIIKTHPMSDYTAWEEFASNNNVTLIHGDYIYNVLNAADIFVGKTGSMTIAESWLIDKPTIKIGNDYDSASSQEQRDLDPLNADNWHDLITILSITLKTDLGRTDEHREYLKEWGIYPLNASEKTAIKILELLNDRQPEMIGETRLADFQLALLNHDSIYGSRKLDGYGNWDKTVLQRDVKDMLWKIQ